MSTYIMEVNCAGNPRDSWSGNGLTFETIKEAQEYGFDLAMRWTAVRDWRVREAASPQDEGPVVWTTDKGEVSA